MTTNRFATRTLLTATLGACLTAPAMATGVDAGSLIANTATATYTANSVSQTVNSNTVSFAVDEVLSVTVASQDAGTISAATSAVLKFKVTNTGNGDEAFTLTANPSVSGNAFNGTITGLAIDTNGNGTYEAGTDTLLTNGAATSQLAADASLDVLVFVEIPSGANAGDLSKIELNATAVTGSGTPGTVFAGAGTGGSDAVVGATKAVSVSEGTISAVKTLVALTKSASIADPFGGSRPVPSSVITYTIVADVTGNGVATSLAVNDLIPTGTTYQAGTLTLEGASLSDASDSDAGEASSSGIAVSLGDVPAGSQRTVTFKVKIN